MIHPQLQVIGVLHCDILDLKDAPKGYDESERTGTLEIFPEYQEGLDGISTGQTILVLFWLHKSDRQVLKVHPRGKTQNKMRGVFSTRSPARPNPIGLSELKVLSVNGNRVTVSGLDILDSTPVIDIKMKIGS